MDEFITDDMFDELGGDEIEEDQELDTESRTSRDIIEEVSIMLKKYNIVLFSVMLGIMIILLR